MDKTNFAKEFTNDILNEINNGGFDKNEPITTIINIEELRNDPEFKELKNELIKNNITLEIKEIRTKSVLCELRVN